MLILVGGWLLYNMVMGFAIHQYELAIDIHTCPLYPEAPSNLPPHPILLGYYWILYWPALLFFNNSLLIRAHCISLQNENMGLKCSKGSFRLHHLISEKNIVIRSWKYSLWTIQWHCLTFIFCIYFMHY